MHELFQEHFMSLKDCSWPLILLDGQEKAFKWSWKAVKPFCLHWQEKRRFQSSAGRFGYGLSESSVAEGDVIAIIVEFIPIPSMPVFKLRPLHYQTVKIQKSVYRWIITALMRMTGVHKRIPVRLLSFLRAPLSPQMTRIRILFLTFCCALTMNPWNRLKL